MLRAIAFFVTMSVGLVASTFNRFAALLTYLWFAFFRPQEWVWFDVSWLRLSLVLGALLVIPSLLSGIFPNLSHPLSIGAVCFLATSLLAQANAVNQAAGWTWLDFMGRLVLVCLLAVSLITTRLRFYLVMAVVAASLGYYTAKAGLVSALGGGVQYYDGLGGAFADNNGYAMAAVMILPFLLAVAQNVPAGVAARKWIRAGFYLSVPLTVLTVVSTFSRGAFIGLAASVLVYVALQRRRLLLVAGLALLLIGSVPLVPLPQNYFSRIGTIQTYEQTGDDSAMGRLHFWRVAVEMARANPLGIGLRNFESAYDRYDFLEGRYGDHRSVHSSHFQVLAENGFAGAAVWAIMFVLAFRTAFRIRGRSRDPGLAPDDQRFLFTMANALLVSMAGFVVGGSFLAMSLNDLTWLTFSLVAALDRLSATMVAGGTGDAAAAR